MSRDDLLDFDNRGMSREDRKRSAIERTAALLERDIRRLGGTPPPREHLRNQARAAVVARERKEQS